MAGNNAPNLHFIVATGKSTVDSETRLLIRSHVMLGKNRTKLRRKAKASTKPETLNAETALHSGLQPPSTIARQLCSIFRSVNFADTVEEALIADVFSFASMSQMAMFTLSQRIVPKTHGMSRAWFEPLLYDHAYLYAACFTTQTYFDQLLSRIPNPAAVRRDRLYYAKTVKILQDRLALHETARLSDSTIMTVLALSGHAYTRGEYESANHHIKGLLKLVSMKGIDAFSHNTKLTIEIVRCDLNMAIDSCSKPIFFEHYNIPWSLMTTTNVQPATDERFRITQHLSDKSRPLDRLLDRLDPGLAAIWAAMSGFCYIINAAATGSGPKLSEEAFLHNMGSNMYRLLHQQFSRGSLNEAFRLGLLAFSSPIFLHWNRIELPDRNFTSALQQAIFELHSNKTYTTPQERMWLVMIMALFMFHETDGVTWFRPWLRFSADIRDVSTWKDMQTVLKSFLWIGLIYDEPSKDIFNAIVSQ